jgi:hypothetical protein
MTAEYVRKLLDVFRVSAIYMLCSLCCSCLVPCVPCLHATSLCLCMLVIYKHGQLATDMYRPQMSLYGVRISALSHNSLFLQVEQRIIRSQWLQSTKLC